MSTDCGCNKDKEIDHLLALLATERDAFAKRETDMIKEHNRWKAKAELYIRKLEQIRSLPMRIAKCSCFNIANKVLRKIEQEEK